MRKIAALTWYNRCKVISARRIYSASTSSSQNSMCIIKTKLILYQTIQENSVKIIINEMKGYLADIFTGTIIIQEKL